MATHNTINMTVELVAAYPNGAVLRAYLPGSVANTVEASKIKARLDLSAFCVQIQPFLIFDTASKKWFPIRSQFFLRQLITETMCGEL